MTLTARHQTNSPSTYSNWTAVGRSAVRAKRLKSPPGPSTTQTWVDTVPDFATLSPMSSVLTSSAALCFSIFIACVTSAAEPLVVEIWPGKVPEETGGIGPERIRMSPKLDHKQVEVTNQ